MHFIRNRVKEHQSIFVTGRRGIEYDIGAGQRVFIERRLGVPDTRARSPRWRQVSPQVARTYQNEERGKTDM